MTLHMLLIPLAISEAIALLLIWRLWMSAEILFFKLSLSLIAIIPFLGPLIVVWVSNFPARAPDALQDKHKSATDVHDRWQDIFREKNPLVKFRKWKNLMKS